jgi:hypothetical protein
MPWSRTFDDPVPGLRTLRDAAKHIMKLTKAEQRKPHWQAACEAVIMAAEDRGPLLHARVGMLRAMNHGTPPEKRQRKAKVYRIIRSD